MTTPEKTLIIGANGQVGRRLVARLAEHGVPVRAMVRNEGQRSDLEALGAEVVTGDLEGAFVHALDGCDALVFTAGSGAGTGADKTLMVDLWGACKTIDACTASGPRRYVMVSARNAGDPDEGPEALRPYLVAKHFADAYLMRSGLAYTILRPGRLTDEPGTGRIRTTTPPADEQAIPRDDVAAAIHACLTDEATTGATIELYTGETLIPEALAAAAKSEASEG